MGFLGEKVRAEMASSGGLESSNWDAVCRVRLRIVGEGGGWGEGNDRCSCDYLPCVIVPVLLCCCAVVVLIQEPCDGNGLNVKRLRIKVR